MGQWRKRETLFQGGAVGPSKAGRVTMAVAERGPAFAGVGRGPAVAAPVGGGA